MSTFYDTKHEFFRQSAGKGTDQSVNADLAVAYEQLGVLRSARVSIRADSHQIVVVDALSINPDTGESAPSVSLTRPPHPLVGYRWENGSNGPERTHIGVAPRLGIRSDPIARDPPRRSTTTGV